MTGPLMSDPALSSARAAGAKAARARAARANSARASAERRAVRVRGGAERAIGQERLGVKSRNRGDPRPRQLQLIGMCWQFFRDTWPFRGRVGPPSLRRVSIHCQIITALEYHWDR